MPPPRCSSTTGATKRSTGLVLNNTRVYAHNVAILRTVKTLAACFEEATLLPLSLKALVRVRVATLNGCPF